MQITSLHSGWTLDLAYADPGYPRPQLKKLDPIPATVPGCVHLDLVANGIIPDPFNRRYEMGVQWVDEADWIYRLSFECCASHSHRILRFECLDTVATIFLNGEQIGTSDNYFIPLEIDVTTFLREGKNDLEVRFASAVQTGVERRKAWFEQHDLPEKTVMFDERAFVRKPGYMSGWDWGPRLVSAGIVGEVSLLEFDHRITSFDVQVSPEGDGWFSVQASAETTSEVTYEFNPANRETEVTEVEPGKWRVRGPLWWPAGMGDQPLHKVTASLADGQRLTKLIGLREIELRRENDEHGQSFEFIVNGRRLWARGANWIPDDSFPARIKAEETEKQIERFAALNFNMLRVWGGGLYESEAFYDACDRLGILVWQDFPFACMYYPDDQPWQDAVRVEAEYQVRRLRHRASLALWCGNNENLAMWQQKWGSSGLVPPRYFGENLYDRVLPEVVAELDPQRTYIESSPLGINPDESIPIGPERNVGIDGWGDSHYWDVWHGRGDWKHYSESKARFSSEFGFASSCSLGQWEACLTEADRNQPFPGQMALHHEKTGKAWETFYGLITLHYAESKALQDWTYYSQLNQRDALRYGIEHYRRSEFCRGSLIWQANDCWPVMSWAVQDYTRALKPAGFELRRLYADVMISIDFVPGDESIKVWVCNDGVTHLQDTLRIEVVDIQTGPTSQSEIEIRLPADSRLLITEIDVRHLTPEKTAVHVSLANDDRWILLAEPKAMNLPAARFETHYHDGQLEVKTKGFVADLVIWDPKNHVALKDPVTGQPGWYPLTGWNVSRSFQVDSDPEELVSMSL